MWQNYRELHKDQIHLQDKSVQTQPLRFRRSYHVEKSDSSAQRNTAVRGTQFEDQSYEIKTKTTDPPQTTNRNKNKNQNILHPYSDGNESDFYDGSNAFMNANANSNDRSETHWKWGNNPKQKHFGVIPYHQQSHVITNVPSKYQIHSKAKNEKHHKILPNYRYQHSDTNLNLNLNLAEGMMTSDSEGE